MSKTDRRVERSQKALSEALLQLMVEQGYAETTVSDITERANVGRSTFYSHFADKEDLLQQSLQGLKEFLQMDHSTSAKKPGPRHPALEFALPMLEHALEQHVLFNALMRGTGGSPVQEHFRIMLTDLVTEHLARELGAKERKEKATALRIQTAAHFIVGSFISVLLWWIADPTVATAAEVDESFRRLALRGLKGFPA